MFSGYTVVSNQFAPHPNTESLAEKHASTNYSRPYSTSQLESFLKADTWARKQNANIILDSGCGTGESTIWLANKYPEHAVIGIDQSASRLTKADNKHQADNLKNTFFVRARLEDFWRLAKEAQWPITHNFLFYPNPWPKSEHLSRRWHGHPVFPALLSLSGSLEVRSNWLIYLEEFSIATRTVSGILAKPELIEKPEGVSAFEKKYRANDSLCYMLKYEFLR